MERARVRVQGVVQSVGFRPFCYRTAHDLDLAGTVRNLGDAGVGIHLEGPSERIDAFLDRLREDAPPLARIDDLDVERREVAEARFDGFEILPSEDADGSGGTVPPDTATCDECLAEMRDPGSRYHGYWATSCVDCGPRFTVIDGLPYDRPRTSMAAYPLCRDCRAEYQDPADRRHHAQAMACPACGPGLAYLTDPRPAGEVPRPAPRSRDPFPDAARVVGGDAVPAAAVALDDGGIVVIKGIGGSHLACDATDLDAVARLRDRTGRPDKPFAVMVPDVQAARRIAHVDAGEAERLTSPRRPILLLRARDGSPLASGVAPGLHTVGGMVAYSGLHHLLFDHVDGPLVMTSANLPGRPMVIGNADIVDRLDGVADGFLLHDRTIVARCDDSVARVVDGRRRLVRRSRGFVPLPVAVPRAGEARVLALGPEMDVAAGVLVDGDCHLTQYVGDVDDPETFGHLRRAVDHLLDLTGMDLPSTVACDLHPGFETTRWADALADDPGTPVERVVQVQHHHAHAASVLADHDVEEAIAIAADGIGYGPDGTVWGGEVLHARRDGFERLGGLRSVPMPGGDRATRVPGRMVAGFLAHRDDVEQLLSDRVRLPGGGKERDVVLHQIDQDLNAPRTSSAGRFLDAVAALLGVCRERTYEGEPAMKLEAAANGGTPRDLDVPRDHEQGRPVVDTPALLDRLVGMLDDGAAARDVAATAQDAMARELADLAVQVAEEQGIDQVAWTGGVAYNDAISARIRRTVEDAGLELLGNRKVPPGDGGIAYGQAVVAAAGGGVTR